MDQHEGRRLLLAMLTPDKPAVFELRVFEPGRDRPRQLWPDDMAAAERLVERHALAGAEVFHGVQPRATARTRELAPGHVVWVDTDTERAVRRLELFDPQPTAVVLSGSSDGETQRRHAYWYVLEALEPRTVRALNLRLCAALDGDTASAEPAHILRTPGSRNRKPGGRVCRCLEFTGEMFSAADLEADLPELDEARLDRVNGTKAAMPVDEVTRLFASDVVAEDYAGETPAGVNRGRHQHFTRVSGYLLRRFDVVPIDVVRELAICWALARMRPAKPRPELVRTFDDFVERELERRRASA